MIMEISTTSGRRSLYHLDMHFVCDDDNFVCIIIMETSTTGGRRSLYHLYLHFVCIMIKCRRYDDHGDQYHR